MLLKKIFLLLSTVFFLLVCFIGLLPWFASTKVGKNTIVSFLNRNSSYSIQIDHLDLNWTGPQTIEGLLVNASNGQLTFNCQKIACESTLLKILLPSHEIEHLFLERPNIEVHQKLLPNQGPKKPQIQVSSFAPSIPINQFLPIFTFPFIGEIVITQGQVTLFSETEDPIAFHSVECRLFTTKDSSKSSFSLKGTSTQKGIEGSLFIESFCKNLGTPDRSINSTIDIKHFPIAGAAELLSLQFPEYNTLLREATGPSLDLNCQIQISKESCLASLNAQSEQMQTHFEAAFDGSHIILRSPGTFTLNATPTLFRAIVEKAPSLASFASETPITFFATLDTLSIPKIEEGLDLKRSSFQGKLGIKPFYAKQAELTLAGLGTFSSPNLEEEIKTDIRLKMQSKETISEPTASFSLKKAFSSSQTLSGSLLLGKTPTLFLDTILPFSFPFADLLGNSLEGSLTVEGSDETFALSLMIKSPLLQMDKCLLELEGKKLTLVNPLQIKYVAHPAVLSHVFGRDTFLLKDSAILSVNISNLQIKDPLEKMQLELQISASPLFFSKLLAFSNYSLETLSIDLNMDSLSQISCQVKSPLFSIDWEGGFDPRYDSVFWKKPAHLHYVLRDEELAQFYKEEKRPLLLTPAPIDVEIAPASLSLHGPLLNQVKLSATLSSKLFSFENSLKTIQASIEDLQAQCLFLGAKDTITFSLTAGLTSSFLEGGKLSYEGSYKHISSSTPLLESTLTLTAFPVELFDTLSNSSMPIKSLIGSPLNLKLITQKSSEKTFCSINGKSPFLEVNGGFQLNSKGLFLAKAKEPLKLQLLVTPNNFAQFTSQNKLPFFLTEEVLIQGSISKLDIPNLSPSNQTPNFREIVLEAGFEAGKVTLGQKGVQDLINLSKTKLSLKKDSSENPLTLELGTETASLQPGSLQVKATFDQLLDSQGKFNLLHIDSKLSALFQKFPAPIFDLCLSMKNKNQKKIAPLFGSFIDAKIDASLQSGSGPFKLQVSSPNTQLSLDGTVNSGTLTLNKNALAQIALNTETSQFFLQEVNPLSLKTISGASPITIEVGAKGFSFPITPFTFKKLEIPNMRITPGKVLCRNEGNINSMLGILKSKQTEQNKQLELWFAPIDLHIRQGLLDLERTEILVANTYDIALWGKVDFPGNKVNMTLGLTASCLKTAFNIKDLPKDYVMHIPLTGTLDHVDLNKGVATSKILALTLWQSKSVAGSAAGGLGGGLLGGVLNQVLSPPGNDASTPAAKTPFPWQSSSKNK